MWLLEHYLEIELWCCRDVRIGNVRGDDDRRKLPTNFADGNVKISVANCFTKTKGVLQTSRRPKTIKMIALAT